MLNELNQEKAINFVNFTSYNVDTAGIFLESILVGLFRLKEFINQSRSIDLYILPEQRGQGLAGIACNKIVEEYGAIYPQSEYFYANVAPNNLSGNRAFKKWDGSKIIPTMKSWN